MLGRIRHQLLRLSPHPTKLPSWPLQPTSVSHPPPLTLTRSTIFPSCPTPPIPPSYPTSILTPPRAHHRGLWVPWQSFRALPVSARATSPLHPQTLLFWWRCSCSRGLRPDWRWCWSLWRKAPLASAPAPPSWDCGWQKIKKGFTHVVVAVVKRNREFKREKERDTDE